MKRGSVLAVHVCLIYICLLTTTAAETAETSSNESSFASVVIGGGISWRWDDKIDFKVADNTLLIENDSRRRPILLTGGLFYVKPFLDKCKIGCLADDVLLSVAFTDAVSQNSIDEFLVGLSKRISNKLNFVVGYSLVRGKELSPGFQESAKRFIKNVGVTQLNARSLVVRGFIPGQHNSRCPMNPRFIGIKQRATTIGSN